MKKILTVAAVLIVATAAVVGIWQRENIAALCMALKYKEAELGKMEAENNEKTNALLQSVTDTQMSELSPEDAERLFRGELTEDEAKKIVVGDDGNGNVETAKIDDIVAEIYVLRAKYLSSLDNLINEAKAEVKKIPSEKRTTATLINIGDVFIARGTALEKECDAQMEGLLEKISAQLKKEKKDTRLVSEIRDVYVNEKRIKKAALYNKYYPKA